LHIVWRLASRGVSSLTLFDDHTQTRFLPSFFLTACRCIGPSPFFSPPLRVHCDALPVIMPVFFFHLFLPVLSCHVMSCASALAPVNSLMHNVLITFSKIEGGPFSGSRNPGTNTAKVKDPSQSSNSSEPMNDVSIPHDITLSTQLVLTTMFFFLAFTVGSCN
jgi:hypothetical protein